MSDSKDTGRSGRNISDNFSAVLATLWGRALAVLAALTMIGGIAAEGLSIYRSWQDSQIANNKILESKAEQCQKRGQYIVDFVPMNQWPEANEQLDLECNPAQAERTRKCKARFKAILSEANDLASFATRIKAYKTDCSLTEEQQKQMIPVFAALVSRARQAEAAQSPPQPRADAPSAPAAMTEPIGPAAANSVVQASVAPPPKPLAFTTYANADMMGGDLQILKETSLDDCIAACRADARCKAYSYDTWNSSCYPKSELHALSLTARSVTAVRESDPEPARSETAVTFEHFRNRAFPRQEQSRRMTPSAAICESRCAAADWCVAYTFYKESYECQLFKSTAAYNPDATADSGSKIQDDQ